MNEIATWMQGNWYALGNLLAQFAFLVAGVWFARRILKTLRASQEQFGALLKLSMTDGLKPNAMPQRPTPYVMAEWPTEAQTPAPVLSEPAPRRNYLAIACRATVRWLKTPMRRRPDAPWRRILHWLQSPVRS
jgi:hypothetical protein